MAGNHDPQAAQAAFYEAFGQGNFEAMSRLWSPTPDAVCIHPAGDLLEGIQAVLTSWRAILSGGGTGRIEFETRARWSAGELVSFTGYEHITPAGSRSPYPPLLATNVYREVEGRWLMLMHHASPIAQPRVAAGATRH